MKKFELYDIPYFDTFFGYVSYISEKFPDSMGICQYDRRGNLTERSYGQLGRDVFAAARAIKADGFAGKHIAIVGENCYEWLAAFLAINCAGAVAVPVDIEQPDETIRAMLQSADVSAAFAAETFIPICAPLTENGGLKRLLRLSGGGDDGFFALCREGEGLDTPLGGELEPDMDSSIFFTSGTTSSPKPVLLSQRNILRNATEGVMMARGTQELYAPLPLYHTYGLNSTVLGSMINGVRITLNGDLKTMLRDLKLSKAETVVAVPLMVEAVYGMLMKSAEASENTAEAETFLKKHRFWGRFGMTRGQEALYKIKEAAGLGRLNQCVVGGANMSRELCEDLGLFGISVLQGYGITECSPLISVNTLDSCRMGSVGHVVPGCRVKFTDGEILVSGTNVMKGYYGDEKLTAEAFDADGWFKTGDLGYMDRDGFLYITGRRKNLIVCKNGNKVSPEMLEALIAPLPLVKEVVVSGTTGGDSTDDVKVVASICPDPLLSADMSALEILERLQRDIDEINRTLPTYQQIQMINIRDDEFEKTASQKIKRSAV